MQLKAALYYLVVLGFFASSCRALPDYTTVRYEGPRGQLILVNGSSLVLCEVLERSETGDSQDLLLPGDVVLPGETRAFQLSAYALMVRLFTCDGRVALEAAASRNKGLVIDYELRSQTTPGRAPHHRRGHGDDAVHSASE